MVVKAFMSSLTVFEVEFGRFHRLEIVEVCLVRVFKTNRFVNDDFKIKCKFLGWGTKTYSCDKKKRQKKIWFDID